MNIAGCLCRFGDALSSAGCILVGNTIGANNYVEARHYYKVFVCFSITVVMIEVTFLNIFCNELVNMYTSDAEVRKRA